MHDPTYISNAIDGIGARIWKWKWITHDMVHLADASQLPIRDIVL